MFIYVFSNQDKNRLLSDGYQLVRADDFGGVYIFVVGDDAVEEKFSHLDKYVLSNVLSF